MNSHNFVFYNVIATSAQSDVHATADVKNNNATCGSVDSMPLDDNTCSVALSKSKGIKCTQRRTSPAESCGYLRTFQRSRKVSSSDTQSDVTLSKWKAAKGAHERGSRRESCGNSPTFQHSMKLSSPYERSNFECPVCDISFPTVTRVTAHFEVSHQPARTHTTGGFNVDINNNTRSVDDTPGVAGLTPCGLSTASVAKNTTCARGPNVFDCPLCNRTYPTVTRVEAHFRSSHEILDSSTSPLDASMATPKKINVSSDEATLSGSPTMDKLTRRKFKLNRSGPAYTPPKKKPKLLYPRVLTPDTHRFPGSPTVDELTERRYGRASASTPAQCTPNKMSPPAKAYYCDKCDFSTTRIETMVYHQRCHSGSWRADYSPSRPCIDSVKKALYPSPQGNGSPVKTTIDEIIRKSEEQTPEPINSVSNNCTDSLAVVTLSPGKQQTSTHDRGPCTESPSKSPGIVTSVKQRKRLAARMADLKNIELNWNMDSPNALSDSSPIKKSRRKAVHDQNNLECLQASRGDKSAIETTKISPDAVSTSLAVVEPEIGVSAKSGQELTITDTTAVDENEIDVNDQTGTMIQHGANIHGEGDRGINLETLTDFVRNDHDTQVKETQESAESKTKGKVVITVRRVTRAPQGGSPGKSWVQTPAFQLQHSTEIPSHEEVIQQGSPASSRTEVTQLPVLGTDINEGDTMSLPTKKSRGLRRVGGRRGRGARGRGRKHSSRKRNTSESVCSNYESSAASPEVNGVVNVPKVRGRGRGRGRGRSHTPRSQVVTPDKNVQDHVSLKPKRPVLPLLESSDESLLSTTLTETYVTEMMAPPTSAVSVPDPHLAEDDMDGDCLATKDHDLNNESDLDEDLPDGLTPSQQDTIKPGDIMWVKAMRQPFWPAVVKRVYNKRHQIRKLSFFFIAKTDKFRHSYSLRYNKKKMLMFGGSHNMHERLLDEGRRSQYSQDFCDSVDWAEDFLIKRADRQLSANSLQFFGYQLQDAEESPSDDTSTGSDYNFNSVIHTVDITESTESLSGGDDSFEDPEMSARHKAFAQKRYDRCTELIAVCRSEGIKDHLSDIHHGTKSSQLYNLYHKPNKTKSEELSLEKMSLFGPIADEEQQNEVLVMLMKIFMDLCGPDMYMNPRYLQQVLIPEALIYAIQVAMRRPREKAVEVYEQGVLYTKEELEQERLSILREKLTPEQCEQQQRRMQRAAERCGIRL